MTPQEEFIEIYNKFEEEKQPQLESLQVQNIIVPVKTVL